MNITSFRAPTMPEKFLDSGLEPGPKIGLCEDEASLDATHQRPKNY